MTKMATKRIPQTLTDSPVTELMNWLGFSAKKEKTMLPPNFLVEPSQNCLIPDGDKVLPRPGSQIVYQGSAPIVQFGTIGKYTKYKNFAGIEMDVKANRQETAGEQVLVKFNDVYVPITIAVNTALNGTGKIYFSTYNDTDLDLSKNKRISRLCWVNGYSTGGTNPKGRVFSWTGGISDLNTVVANVITLPAGETWRKLGFTENFPNATEIHVTINGVDYFSTSVAELDTDTLTLNANPVAVAGDIVTSSIEVDELVAPMDMLKQNKNYMYYGNEMFRQWWMSNQFGRPSVTRITGSNASQDDLIIDPLTNYTGKGKNVYKFTIVSTDPASPAVSDFNQVFHGTGTPIYFNTAGYNIADGDHTYILKCIYTNIHTAGTYVGTIQPGEPIIGGTSGAYGTLNDDPQADPFNETSVHTISGTFEVGEVITGQFSGATYVPNAIRRASSVIFFKDGIQYPLSVFFSGNAILDRNGVPSATPLPLPDGLAFVPNVQNQFINLDYGDYVELRIRTASADPGSPDEFTWQKNNGTVHGPDDVETSPIAIEDGIVIKWAADMGHSVGDYWLIEVNQIVTRPWANFYYTIDLETQNSVRRPGEGYIYSLPANFWTMDTFEEALYVNTSNGEWGYSSPQLSADLLSEDISFVPLKQVGSSKVLYPYLTGHNRNDMLFIDEGKNLNSMGRLQLLQRVQMKNMSDFVLNKFQKLSFVDGSIIFQDNGTYITSPHDNTMMLFNERTSYWQPPQFIPNLGLLTLIGTELYTHSYIDSATRRLNDPTADGDDGIEYEVIIRSSTYDHGDRWNQKTSNMAFWEAYVFEKTAMKMNAYFGVDKCSVFKTTDIIPVFCDEAINNGNQGGGNDGGHQDGGDESIIPDYARFNWNDLKVHDFYFSSLEFRCRAKRHKYEILSMGLNLSESKFNNKQSTPPETALENLLPLK